MSTPGGWIALAPTLGAHVQKVALEHTPVGRGQVAYSAHTTHVEPDRERMAGLTLALENYLCAQYAEHNALMPGPLAGLLGEIRKARGG
jgi:hypothetical protein